MRGEVLTRAEVQALLHACTVKNGHGLCLTGIRNRAMLGLAYRSGLRSAELVQLRPPDVFALRPEVRVRRGKGGRARVVPLDVEGLSLVAEWLRAREQLPVTRIDPLFCTLAGRELSTRYLRSLLPRLAKRAGLDRRVHPHALRHTYAVELAREGVAMPAISRLLGHGSLATTETYLAGLCTPAELRAAVQNRQAWLDR
jgi:integrase/recombinase XerC